MSAQVTVGAKCFFTHPTYSWILGSVDSCDPKNTFTCTSKKGQWEEHTEGGDTIAKVKEDNVFVYTDPEIETFDTDDLLTLTVLHDATIMHVLRLRYFKDVIYTNIGQIAVAVNPFNYNIPWYKDDFMPNYLKEGHTIQKNKPHSWAVAHNTYYELTNDRQDQCILVSGESGAGKTEAAKIVMKYLGRVSCLHGNEEQQMAAMGVGYKIQQASPVLEGFGNAKTVRNDNSSRFGKFMKVKFNKDGFLTGADTTKYLLEKSRVVTSGEGERVYHAFYQIAAGDAAKFQLGAAKTYKSLTAGNCVAVSGVDDSADYAANRAAMKIMGIAEEDIESVWATVAGILHIQNVDFVPNDEKSKISGNTTEPLQLAAKCWGISADDLEKELLTTTNIVRGQTIVREHSVPQATDIRDALSKALYDNLFGWLVTMVNKCTNVDIPGNWIGLLDIFGFEDFAVNSLEQLCINLANETLQGHYNKFIFEKDLEECRAEGVDATSIEFPDNTPCLELITGQKGGLFALLDEQCALGKGSDEGFLQAITDKHKKHAFFLRDKLAKTSFQVRHYAGDVSYTVSNFLEKNKDNLKDALKLLMRGSSASLIKELLPQPVDIKGAKGKFVGKYFKDSLAALMEIINSTNPHWIRCVKPHPAKKPLMFHGPNVLNQLTSAGVMGTVRVRKAGFPIRIKFPNFIRRFRVLMPGQSMPPKELCTKLCEVAQLDKKKAQVGTTRVYMKTECYVELERQLVIAQARYVDVYQRAARAYVSTRVAGCHYKEAKLRIVQAFCRMRYSRVRVKQQEFELKKDFLLENAKMLLQTNINENNARQDVEDEEFDMWEDLLTYHQEGLDKLYSKWLEAKPIRDGKQREELEVEQERPKRKAILREEQQAIQILLERMRADHDKQLDKALERERVEAELRELQAKREAEKERKRQEIRRMKHRQVAIAIWKEIEDQHTQEMDLVKREKQDKLFLKDHWEKTKMGMYMANQTQRRAQMREKKNYPSDPFIATFPKHRVIEPREHFMSPVPPSATKEAYGFSGILEKEITPPPPTGTPTYFAKTAKTATMQASQRSGSPQSSLGGGVPPERCTYSALPRSHRLPSNYIQECFSNQTSPKKTFTPHNKKHARVASPKGAGTQQLLSSLRRVQHSTRPRDIPHVDNPFDINNPKNPNHPDWDPADDCTVELPDGTLVCIPPITVSNDEMYDEDDELLEYSYST